LVVGKFSSLPEGPRNLNRLFLSFALLALPARSVQPTITDERPTTNDQRRTTNNVSKENPITRADIPAFTVIGIEARTTNAKEATADGIIPKQWQKFFQEGILAKIPNKSGQNIYALYTDYDSGRNGEYSFVIGAIVKDGIVAPVGMVAKYVSGGRFAVLTSDKGPLAKVMPAAWQSLWKMEDEGKLKRSYQTDFEIYDQRAQDPQNAQVDIYVGLK
jgi:predicted transcriptional regulator YdeE